MHYAPLLLDDIDNKPWVNPLYASKINRLDGRKVVYLPSSEEHRSQWESYGITWIEPAFKHNRLANAVLPEGWELRYNISLSSYTLLDGNHLPRINIKIDPLNGASTQIVWLGEKEIKLQLQEEEIIESTKKSIADNRSDTWSESHPFGIFEIFFEAKHGNFQSGLHRVDPQTGFAKENYCYGFFSTENLANLAQKFAKDHICHKEHPPVAPKIMSADLRWLERKGYKIINPFI